jgi:hypothetical protein
MHDVSTFALQQRLCLLRLQASVIHAPHLVPRMFEPNLKMNARRRVGRTAPADKGLKKLNSNEFTKNISFRPEGRRNERGRWTAPVRAA